MIYEALKNKGENYILTVMPGIAFLLLGLCGLFINVYMAVILVVFMIAYSILIIRAKNVMKRDLIIYVAILLLAIAREAIILF